MKTYFKSQLEKMNIQDVNDKMTKFDTYFKFMVEYNEFVNLTSITEEEQVYEKHFLDSVLPVKELKENSTICDIGTGAGFPSIPLAVLRNDLKVYAVDSLLKRINFLEQLKQKLNLNNVNLFQSRAEDFAKLHREEFDYVVSRAVASLNTLLELTLPLTKVGGYVLAYKSLNYEIEINESANALKILGGKIEKILEFDLPFSNQKRYILMIKKVSKTPLKYPRGQNKPKLQPL